MTVSSQAALPQFLVRKDSVGFINQLAVVAGGVFLLSLLAQISIPLPWTPVPITGQTFGVSLMALLYGRRLGTATVAVYLLAGISGAPILATAALGPTAGYLVGMLVGAAVMGWLADRGWSQSYWWAFAAAIIGSVFIFVGGVAVLAAFVPAKNLLDIGVMPFIPGDLLKSMLAAGIAVPGSRWLTSSRVD